MSHVGLVAVFLRPVGEVSDSVGPREITITKDHPVITVGRSSRNKTKNLLPNFNNAYFDSPVMSRSHAWIKCDDEGQVLIADAQSMHGTFLDDKLLEPKSFVPLDNGATVRFGNSVVRGTETFPPKKFVVKITKGENMNPVQHGYGISSDELVLPDSPYYSEDEDVMITEVKVVKKTASEADYWEEEPPSEIPTSAIRESLNNNSNSDDFEAPPVFLGARKVSHIDLTDDDAPTTSPPKVVPRMSIAELLANQERREQSRQSSKTPAREGAAKNPVFIDSEDEDEDAEYDPEIEEEINSSELEVSPESAPTSPTSEGSSKISSNSLPLPDIQTHNPVSVTAIPLERVPALDDIPISPEVKQAWTSTWKAPLLSRFPFCQPQDLNRTPDSKPFDFTSPLSLSRDSITNLANRTKLAMEQVRRAEAMRDRAHEFWKSRSEMQHSSSFATPTKEREAEKAYPTPESAGQINSSSAPTAPLWVRHFGNYFGTKSPSGSTDSANEPVTADSPCDGFGERIEDAAEEPSLPSSPLDARTGSPEHNETDLDLVMSDGDEEEVSNTFIRESSPTEEPTKDPVLAKEIKARTDDSDFEEDLDISDIEEKYPPGYMTLDSYEFGDETESEEEEDYGEEDEDEDEDDEDEMDEDEDDVDDDEDGDEEDEDCEEEIEESGADEEDDAPLITLNFNKAKSDEPVISNTVKSAMSMENFFSPNDEPVYSSQSEWDKGIPVAVEAPIPSSSVDPELAPPAAKKRKRDLSEEPESCQNTSIITEIDISTRRIAPLPRRHVSTPTTPIPASSAADEERSELLALAQELKVELEAEAQEPEKKKAKVEGCRPGWGSTLATALAGAVVGGVGVFAALVATAGEL
ncbi:hypothetical protein ABW19_dt0200833 [Dactylella cylindrospora]|nr:hypothetical protein ABW19_dt0200833 [Dactylella cylindrospora]